MYKLIIEDDEGKTTVVPLIRDEITIGRKEGNTIRLTERNVSRKHAKLFKQNGGVFIEDLTSYNGIKINGDRVAGRQSVSEGDRIQIGDYQLALKLDKGAQAGAGGTQTSAAPNTEIIDQKTTPFVKENGTPTQLIEAPTMQTPLVPPGTTAGEAEGLARLVVVSSNFAGQEFLLDKAAVVIGRTDENDVVINHRSISRHHAKVVRENHHYHIVDLQSANGVRVNGEEYGKVELRRGDHVDLGHVRLRFISPGEDFVFERDAQVVDVSGAGRSRLALVTLLFALMVVIGGGAFALLKMAGQKPGAETPRPAADVESQVAKLLLDADRATKSEDWEAAITRCDDALKLDPTQELARDKRQRAEAERKNRAAYGNFTGAAEKADFDSAVASYGEVAEDSVYRQRGAEKYALVKKGYLRLHLDAERKAKNAGRCEEARQHAEAVLTIDEGNPEALEINRGCGVTPKPQGAVSEHTEKRPPKPPTEPRAPRPPVAERDKPVRATAPTSEEGDTPTPPGVNPAAEKSLAEAQDAYVHGAYANAIEIAKRAIKAQPMKAWRIIGASNCFLKDRNGALQAWNKLDAQARQFLKYVCSRNSITVP
jgi:pSer/pThr/pTyr-binding forkhead associated (FHA) protein